MDGLERVVFDIAKLRPRWETWLRGRQTTPTHLDVTITKPCPRFFRFFLRSRIDASVTCRSDRLGLSGVYLVTEVPRIEQFRAL